MIHLRAGWFIIEYYNEDYKKKKKKKKHTPKSVAMFFTAQIQATIEMVFRFELFESFFHVCS